MSSSDARVVVVGASHAAVALADRLRRGGHTGPLTLIGAETHLPYHRPPLSKAYLKGDVDLPGLALRGDDYFREAGISLRTGERVVDIEQGADGSGTARTDASSYEFDRLVLATGARPRRLTIPGSDHRDVLVLRDLDDSVRLKSRVRSGPVVVIGGGFIGLEVAATVTTLGGRATVVEMGPSLMGRAVGPSTAKWIAAVHASVGIGLETNSSPEEIVVDKDRIVGVRLSDGRTIDAATVLVGIGVVPRDELARSLGLDCAAAGGVVVDENCLTSDGRTIAIGDCTVQPRPGSVATDTVRLESVDNADEQAARAAATLLGTEAASRAVPWFWSDQGATKLQIVGLIDGYDEVLVRTDPQRPDRRSVIYFKEGYAIAVECLNSAADFLIFRRLLNQSSLVSKAQLADESVPLRGVLKMLSQAS